jgi:hypothetical protein
MEFSTVELLRPQHENASKPGRSSGYYDVTALPVATVHCDIVVTEKYLVLTLRRHA